MTKLQEKLAEKVRLLQNSSAVSQKLMGKDKSPATDIQNHHGQKSEAEKTISNILGVLSSPVQVEAIALQSTPRSRKSETYEQSIKSDTISNSDN